MNIINKLKRAHKSFTIWFNLVGAGLLSIALTEPTLIEYLSNNNLNYILIVGNLILRFKTNSDMAKK